MVVIDGWANFAEAMPKHVDTVMSLMRARNYGVRVVLTHTSHLSGMRTGDPRGDDAEAGAAPDRPEGVGGRRAWTA